MLVFTLTVVTFLSQRDHFSNVPGLVIFTCVSFSHYNLFPLAIFPICCSVYQNSHYLSRSYLALKLDCKALFLFCSDKDGKKLDLKADEYDIFYYEIQWQTFS